MPKLGVFWKIQDICYNMGTEIFKIKEKMTEKIKPKVANRPKNWCNSQYLAKFSVTSRQCLLETCQWPSLAYPCLTLAWASQHCFEHNPWDRGVVTAGVCGVLGWWDVAGSFISRRTESVHLSVLGWDTSETAATRPGSGPGGSESAEGSGGLLLDRILSILGVGKCPHYNYVSGMNRASWTV